MRSEARLTGVVGRVEDKKDKNGGKMTILSVAVDKSYKNKETGEKVENTEWFSVFKFGGLPEKLTASLKGSLVNITGELTLSPKKEDEYPQISIKLVDIDVLRFAKKDKSGSDEE